MKTPIITLAIVLANCINVFASQALQITHNTPTFFEYLAQNNVSEITITSDFKQFKKSKDEGDYQAATIDFETENGDQINLEVEIRARGNKRKEICLYPPIKLKMGTIALNQLGVADEDEYKLVCQCEKGEEYQQMLLKEFMAYQLYNIVTENSFKTHLFKFNRVDTKTGKTEVQYAFVIEKMNSLRNRLHAKKIEDSLVNNHQLDRNSLLRMCLFQYLIGNTDLGLNNQHNLKVAKKEDAAFFVAYDFDYSGLVNAPYAAPPEIFPINRVSDRYFMFTGCDYEEISKEVNYMLEKEKDILDYCVNFDLLSKSSQKKTQKYLTAFFDTLKNDKKVRREFIKKN